MIPCDEEGIITRPPAGIHFIATLHTFDGIRRYHAAISRAAAKLFADWIN
jgi:hypothetical protein